MRPQKRSHRMNLTERQRGAGHGGAFLSRYHYETFAPLHAPSHFRYQVVHRLHNQDPKPFAWTAKADDIMSKVIYANRRRSDMPAVHFELIR